MSESDTKPVAEGSTPSNDDIKDKGTMEIVPLKSTPIPPGHAIATLIALIAISVANLPSMESIEEAASIKTLTNGIFPIFNAEMLAYIRSIFAVIIWLTVLYGIFLEKPTTLEISYVRGSKLIQAPIQSSGIKTLFFFTSISWCFLGIAFTLLSIIAFKVSRGEKPSPELRSAAFIFWEVSAPTTLLVSGIVKYVLWPNAIEKGTGGEKNLKKIRAMLQHNANTIFALLESTLLSGLPVRLSDCAMSTLFGCVYVLFLWSISRSWGGPEIGPQVIYFFLDPTAPGYSTSYSLVALVGALLICYTLYAFTGDILAMLGGGFWVHYAYFSVVAGLAMKLRD